LLMLQICRASIIFIDPVRLVGKGWCEDEVDRRVYVLCWVSCLSVFLLI